LQTHLELFALGGVGTATTSKSDGLFYFMTYQEKLRDPRWQKKRLEIMQRDDFQCTCCGDRDSEIHVHHSYYEFGKEVWEYDNETLSTLCSSCHYQHTLSQKRIKELMRTIQYENLYQFEKIVELSSQMNPYELSLVQKYCVKILEKYEF
jgi:5-methylcytosine-specific restriction endonuclease McrA